ncbi:hypothetical protein Y032_0227g2797 [Ancylostoma ceylanicum]|uniref:Uncharacterized protein n=1 Tax=Ancylostoma ceylanicum TaxID=53326 RepID=A0A016SHJ5_9BILA|nr:hypothetical protein Y032_0227g2797 [Ancylostoma ceylanicum]
MSRRGFSLERRGRAAFSVRGRRRVTAIDAHCMVFVLTASDEPLRVAWLRFGMDEMEKCMLRRDRVRRSHIPLLLYEND